MKKSNALILSLVAFFVGLMAGLFIAAYKGTPAILNTGAGQGMNSASSETQPDSASGLQDKLVELKNQIEKNPDDARLYVQAGNLAFDLEDYQEAITFYNQAVKLGHEDPDVLTDAGIAYRRIGKPEEAVNYFKKAHDLDPKHENSLLNLGIVLFHDLGDKKDALDVWKQYLALNPQGERADMIRKVVAQIESSGDKQ